MKLRSVFARRTTADPVRKMRAVLGVLDHDLAELQTLLTRPIPATTLSESRWRAAEAARAAVAKDLEGLEAEAAAAAAEASGWRTRASLAEQSGHGPLAEQARVRVAEAEQAYRSYAKEVDAIRNFLQEWDARVTRDER